MKEAKRALATLALAFTVGCSSHLNPATPPQQDAVALRIYSTDDSFPLLQTFSHSFSTQFPNTSLDINFNNQGNLLEQLETGEISYFLSHHYPVESDKSYWAAPLAQDGLVLIVHPENPLHSISLDDLRRVYRGYITNWQELGGGDLPISLYSREENAGIRQEFERLVMGQERTSPNAQILPSSDAVLDAISQNRSAIAYLPLSLANENVRLLAINDIVPSVETIVDNRYPLRMMLYMVGLNEAQNSYLDFVAWAQGNSGQAVLAPQYAPLPP